MHDQCSLGRRQYASKRSRRSLRAQCLCAATLALLPHSAIALTLSADPVMRWHRQELVVTEPGAPGHSEGSRVPFRDRRLDCLFTSPSGQAYLVYGFYAGGNDFACRFTPPALGTWSVRAELRARVDVFIELAQSGSLVATETGSFQVIASDKAPPDLRSDGLGWIRNAGSHHLSYTGSTQKYFTKVGLNSGETFLAYRGFDNPFYCTPSRHKICPGCDFRHDYANHVQHWRPGDPTFACTDGCSLGDRGRGIIGAINYLAGDSAAVPYGVNSKYLVTLDDSGDSGAISPFTSCGETTRYDVSRLEQWRIVFEHMNARGILVTMQLFDDGEAARAFDDNYDTLSADRKAYFAEMINRFAFLPGLVFVVGEEDYYSPTRVKNYAAYIKQLDPYDHPVGNGTHSRWCHIEDMYRPLVCASGGAVDMTSWQVGSSPCGADQGPEYFDRVRQWVLDTSSCPPPGDAAEPWAISVDENRTSPARLRERYRKLWPTLMAGGNWEAWITGDASAVCTGGGASTSTRDHCTNDYADMETDIAWLGAAAHIFAQLDAHLGTATLWPRTNPVLTSPDGFDGLFDHQTYKIGEAGQWYAAYSGDGGPFTVDLTAYPGRDFAVMFYDPGTAAACAGSPVAGGALRNVGSCTCCTDIDEFVLITRRQGGASTTTTVTTTVTVAPPTPTTTTTTVTVAPPVPTTTTTTLAPAPPTTVTTTTTTTVPSGGPGGISIDSANIATGCQPKDSPSLLITVTVAPAQNKMLVIGAACEDNDHRKCDFATASAAFGATPAVLATATKSDTDRWMSSAALWYVADAALSAECAGVFPCTRAVTVTPGAGSTAPDNLHGGVLVLSKVAQVAPEATAQAGSDPCAAALTTPISTLSNGAWVVDLAAVGNNAAFGTSGVGQSPRWTNLCVSSSSQATTKPIATAATTTLEQSHSNPNRCAHVLMAIAPAAASTATTTTTATPPPVPTTTTTTTVPPPPPTPTTTTTTTLAGAPDAISLDGASVVSQCELKNSTVLSFDVTVSAHAARVLVVGAGCEDAIDSRCDFASASARFGATPLLLADANKSDTTSWMSGAALWYLLDAAIDGECAGIYPCTRTVTIDPSLGLGPPDNLHGGAFLLSGAAQTPPEAVVSTGSDPCGGGLSTDLATTTDGAWVIDVGISGNKAATAAPGPGQIARWTNACISSSSQATTKHVATAGPTTMTINHNGPNRCSHVLISIAPH